MSDCMTSCVCFALVTSTLKPPRNEGLGLFVVSIGEEMKKSTARVRGGGRGSPSLLKDNENFFSWHLNQLQILPPIVQMKAEQWGIDCFAKRHHFNGFAHL
jgi:hypothetical protein